MKKINKTQAAIFNIEYVTKTTFKEDKGDNKNLLNDIKRSCSGIKKVYINEKELYIVTFQYKSNHGFNKYAKLYERHGDCFKDVSYYFKESKYYKTNDIGAAFCMSNCFGFSLESHVCEYIEKMINVK